MFVCERLLGQEYNEYKIKRQIKAYISQNITRKDILKSLQYWYFVKKNDISKANGGIGIVGFIYQEAEEYFKNQERIKKAAENVDVESFLNPDTVQFSIKPKQSHLAKGTKGFNLI